MQAFTLINLEESLACVFETSPMLTTITVFTVAFYYGSEST